MLEAMAHGLAIAGTTCGGVCEAVEHGRSGLLAGQHDVAGFASHLERLIVDSALRDRLATAARRRVEARFDRASNLDAVLASLGEAGLVSPRREESKASKSDLLAVA
jgi:glycosyltransferase involved in cell wall biosynthesis